MLERVIAAVAVSALAGCDMSHTPPPGPCTQLGAQCQYGEGVLGVCENVECEAGKSPPCFQCVDQH